MVDSVARVQFHWDTDMGCCRASAFDALGKLLGEAIVELPEEVRTTIWAQRGHSARFRIEEATERHLRAMLDLRY